MLAIMRYGDYKTIRPFCSKRYCAVSDGITKRVLSYLLVTLVFLLVTTFFGL
jgi:hypothetical protein